MYDIITIGAAVRDVFLLSDQFQMIRSDAFETGVGECVPLGSKIEVDKKIETTGGGATNAAVTFSRLGFSAAIVCRVGEDSAGREIIQDLKKEKVATALIQRVPHGETAYSALLTATGGERSILTYRGVSASFTNVDIPWRSLEAKWIYITSLGGNISLTERIIKSTNKEETQIAWNPGGKELAMGLVVVQRVLRRVSLLLINREEAARLTGKENIAEAFVTIKASKQTTVIITDGDKGSWAFSNGKAWHSGTTGAPSLSRTGAGDAFGSGLVAGLMHGFTLPQALALGTLNAESVIKHVGAKHGILKRWPSPSMLARIPVKTLSTILPV